MASQQERELHNLVLSTFNGDEKRGYNWLFRKFDGKGFSANETNNKIRCLKSKKAQTECPIHNRTHEAVL